MNRVTFYEEIVGAPRLCPVNNGIHHFPRFPTLLCSNILYEFLFYRASLYKRHAITRKIRRVTEKNQVP